MQQLAKIWQVKTSLRPLIFGQTLQSIQCDKVS